MLQAFIHAKVHVRVLLRCHAWVYHQKLALSTAHTKLVLQKAAFKKASLDPSKALTLHDQFEPHGLTQSVQAMGQEN